MKNFETKDLLFIDKMITPTIINILYWLLCAIVVLGGLVGVISGKFLMILVIPFGWLYIRVMCEIMVVIFKINANIQRIADKSKE